MDKILFSDGQKISSAKVTIDGVDYPVTPARYTGATPLSSVVMNEMQTNIENAIDQNTDNIGGEEYDETQVYYTGDITKHEGQLYIANQDILTPEEWDSTKWDATDVLSSAGGNEVVIGTSADITGKTKIFIDESEGTDAYSEVVDSLSGNEIAKAPSVRAVNEGLLDVYSTDEVRIGTWIDGKPIYRKTFTGTTGSTDYVDLSTPNVDKLINEGGYIFFSSFQFPVPSTFGTDGANDIRVIKLNANTLRIQHGSGLQNRNYEIFVEYTKTSD